MHKPGCTIYVGDLHPITLESDLFRLFSPCGTVSNIKIIRNPSPTPLSSACYAYINFDHPHEAEHAVQKYNFTTLHNRQMRIMIFDKTRKDYNVIIKNLHSSVDNKVLYDTFSVFGEITSCKVVLDSANKSKGYGFVSYKSKSAAKKAIGLANNTNMKGNVLKVNKHVKNSERQSRKDEVERNFTNVYCKNWDLTEIEIEKLMKRFGNVTSLFFPRKEDGTIKGVVFCNYESNECARNAIEALHDKSLNKIKRKYIGVDEDNHNKQNNTKVNGEPISENNCSNDDSSSSTNDENVDPFYCQRAQSKTEREEELRTLMQKLSMEGQNFKRNLYVTNIPENYSEEEIKTLFTNLGGKITSFMLKKDNNTNRQFCYVCYSTPDEASIAIEKGSEIFLDGNKLSITYFKTKMERQLERENESINISPFKYGSENFVRKSVDKKQLGGDLYNLVLSMAGMFQDDWKRMGIKDEYSFAERITKSLLERPSSEVRNMMGLGNVLSQNISDILKDVKFKTEDNN